LKIINEDKNPWFFNVLVLSPMSPSSMCLLILWGLLIAVVSAGAGQKKVPGRNYTIPTKPVPPGPGTLPFIPRRPSIPPGSGTLPPIQLLTQDGWLNEDSWEEKSVSELKDMPAPDHFADMAVNALGPYPATYNLIDVTPSCYATKGLCEYAAPGMPARVHPNAEERFAFLAINTVRLFPQEYIKSAYGRSMYGTSGPDTTFYTGQANCGKPADLPYYWMSEAGQAARFLGWANAKKTGGMCNHTANPHATCDVPNRCALFVNETKDKCGFGARVQAFTWYNGPKVFPEAEGLCGANMCLTEGHCGSYFNNEPGVRYIGLGFWPGSNGWVIDSMYRNAAFTTNFKIPVGAHFDRKIKVPKTDWDTTGKQLTFMAVYWGPTAAVGTGYVAFNGTLLKMGRTMGNHTNGVYEARSVYPSGVLPCMPYYFVFKNPSDGFIARLPEDPNMFFGTAWDESSWWKPTGMSMPTFGQTPFPCSEYSYYRDPKTKAVRANGDAKESGLTGASCKGCSLVARLP